MAFSAAGLAIVGMVLPLMPGTVFAIVAAWAASRSSPTLGRKIRNNKYIGPMIQSWENGRAIPNGAKLLASGLMALSLLKLWWFGASQPVLIGLAIFFALVIAFILSRPSPQAVARKLAATQASEQLAFAENPLSQQKRPIQTENEQQRQAASQ